MSEAAAAPGFARLLSDDRLTQRAVGGDERAFAAIFRRYHQPLYRFCLAIVGNPEDAQDALQNTMMKVLRALPGEERKIDLKPWLYRIAHNESIDLLRRRRETRQLDVEQIAPGYGLAEDAATRERLRRLIVDLKALPERQREVLVMRELAGLDFEEIGTALETSGAVARQTLYEARQSLRQMEEGREMSCATVTKALSDGDGRVTRRRDVRAHLRSCPDCRAFRDGIKSRQQDLAALSPLPAVAAAGMLQGLLGGSQAATGGGLAAALGGGAAKTIGISAAAKGVATVAVVGAIGVTAADRTGVIHVDLPGGSEAKQAKQAPATPGAATGQEGGRSDAAAASGRAGIDSGDPRERQGGAQGAIEGSKAGGALGEANGDHRSASAHPHAQDHGRRFGHEKAASAPQGPPVEHASGQGHEKQTPAAATGGQDTAADHKSLPPEPSGGGDRGSSGGHAVTPTKPSPPSTPAPAPPVPPSPAPPEEAPGNPPAAAPEPPPQAQPPAPEKAAPEAAQDAGASPGKAP
ncbi:MAG TPA: RNA polymerase sigma factor [Solirubrobacterales bacterium]|jgi:RNA polymerase sigma factor (sigma-70 family)